jgi:hypothetical protein
VIYKRDIGDAAVIFGPALIVDDFTTILVLRGWEMINHHGHLVAQKIC